MKKHRLSLKPSPDNDESDYQEVVAIISGVISEEIDYVAEIEIADNGEAIFFKSSFTHRQFKDAMKSTFSYYLDTVRYVDIAYC